MKVVDGDKIKRYIQERINPYGKPTIKNAYEFGLEIMEYVDNMFTITEENECD